MDRLILRYFAKRRRTKNPMMNDTMYISPYHRSCTGPMRKNTGSMLG